jgi:predicted enzyme related to lactoylglutathione lyase
MTDGATQATTGKIVWFEIPARDTARARGFYGELFGWQFQPYDGQDYHSTYEAGGAIFAAPEQNRPMVFFGVEDLDAAIARVRELGGEAGEKQEIPNIGFYVHAADTEGNPIGLYQGGAGA